MPLASCDQADRLDPMITTLAALVLCAFPLNKPPVEIVFDFSKLTPETARQLEGEEAVFSIVLDSLDDEDGKYTLYDCHSEDEVLRSVWLLPGQEVRGSMTVRAVLRILHHAASVGSHGTFFLGFTECRLVDAVQR